MKGAPPAETIGYIVLNTQILTKSVCIYIYMQAEELFLWIPRKMLMTVESAQNSVLGKDFKQ